MNIKNKKVAAFCCQTGGMGKVKDHFKSSLKDNTLLGQLDIIDPAINNTQEKVQQAVNWIKSF